MNTSPKSEPLHPASCLAILALACLTMVRSAPAADSAKPDAPRIALAQDDANHSVRVTIDGAPFTSYLYPDSLEKPVLCPIRTAKGTIVTRGYPLQPAPGEPNDHPHHVGYWFNFGDVNGIDFWGNSFAIKGDKKAKCGTIRQKSIDQIAGGTDEGKLAYTADWLASDGTVVLTEKTTFLFRGTADTRTIDRITTLTAGGKDAVFHNTKEGMLGLRVAKPLQQPDTKTKTYTDAHGVATKVPAANNEGVTGKYHGSNGKDGDAVWGTRADWMELSGKFGEEHVAVVIFDHKDNPGYPTRWHARGYGLFAANPFGGKDMEKGTPAMNFTIPAGKSATFKYRLLIDSRPTVTDEDLNKEFAAFNGK